MTKREDLEQIVSQFETDLKRKRNVFLRLAVISGIVIVGFGATKGFAENRKFMDGIYINLGQENLTKKSYNGYEMEQRQNVGRVGYQFNDDWSVELELAKVNGAYDFNSGVGAFYTWSDQSLWIRKSFLQNERVKPFVRAGVVQMKEDGSQATIVLPDGVMQGYDWKSIDHNVGFGIGAEMDISHGFGLRWDTSYMRRDKTDLEGERTGKVDEHIKTGLTAVYSF